MLYCTPVPGIFFASYLFIFMVPGKSRCMLDAYGIGYMFCLSLSVFWIPTLSTYFFTINGGRISPVCRSRCRFLFFSFFFSFRSSFLFVLLFFSFFFSFRSSFLFVFLFFSFFFSFRFSFLFVSFLFVFRFFSFLFSLRFSCFLLFWFLLVSFLFFSFLFFSFPFFSFYIFFFSFMPRTHCLLTPGSCFITVLRDV